MWGFTIGFSCGALLWGLIWSFGVLVFMRSFGFGFWYEVVDNVSVTFRVSCEGMCALLHCLSCPDLILDARCKGFMNFFTDQI